MKRADHHLVQQVLDGDIDRDGFDDFQNRLREESGLVDLYTDYALLHHTLHEEVEGAGALGLHEETSSRGLRMPAWAAVAAAIAFSMAGWWTWRWLDRNFPGEAAVLTFSPDASWRLEGTSRTSGGATGVKSGGTLHLHHGRAAISLKPAVRAVIEGPAKVVVTSADSLHIQEGRGFFHRAGDGGGLTVTTPKLTALDSGTEFGLETLPNATDELHVISGSVKVTAVGSGESRMLAAGESAKVFSSGLIETLPSDGRRFATGLGRFTSVVSGDFATGAWRIHHGTPSITPRRIEGANFSVFLRLPHVIPEDETGVMLATLELGKAADAPLHTDGWAGMSFYNKGEELMFFGDTFGNRPTWALDVKHRVPVILPDPPVKGERIVTLRYDARSGDVTLHEGGLPLSDAFCGGKIPPGTRFDEIRIAASAGAALAVNSLHIRTRAD
jgi:hypothetical protein